MVREETEVIFLLKGKNLDNEVEIDSGESSVRKAITSLANNWDRYGLDNSQFGEIESLRIVLRS